MIWGKIVWHRWFEFNSTGLVDGVFHCSLLTCCAAEDTGALSRRFLHLSSLRERKSICQGDRLSEKKWVCEVSLTLGTPFIQMQALFLVEKVRRPMLHEGWTTCRPLRFPGILGAPCQQLHCTFPSFPMQRWLGAPEVMGCSGGMGGHQLNRLQIKK